MEAVAPPPPAAAAATAGGVDANMLEEALRKIMANQGHDDEEKKEDVRGVSEDMTMQGNVQEERKRRTWKEEEEEEEERARRVEAFLRERVRHAEQEDALAAAACSEGAQYKQLTNMEVCERSRASMHRFLFLD